MVIDSALELYGRLWLWIDRVLGPARLPTPQLPATDAAADGPVPAARSAGLPPFAIDPTTVDISALIEEHSDAAYRVAYSITGDRDLAEDVTQDALIKAWQKLATFRGDAPLRNWILRITHNTAISTVRRRRDEARDPNELPERPTVRTVHDDVADRLALERFMASLDQLDDLSRSIVVLRELEAMSYEEICHVLGVPLPTVKTRLLRARRHLADALEEWVS